MSSKTTKGIRDAFRRKATRAGRQSVRKDARNIAVVYNTTGEVPA